ncbi:sensor histidine kinase [Paenibacillus sp. PsM32]|uniref:sensor histidine kinase n=1 Tax=unclassified Paenibacillus TaxID=185978 RepID=UPI00263A887B|nr:MULTISPECIES: sensor histidine kinase [unclassified Paenibacillus]MDN4621000.1 sensor histidine kinase [Paenibacillus sp. PsM32]MDQ1235713.1 two-component system sensor histidine kinase YesM [Paenibacillus sp. SORGH_AS_0306]MDR6112762.1 two-component system sensor histidine kinase YesM [Paenibacillus sp. SORGH_AS_0338]
MLRDLFRIFTTWKWKSLTTSLLVAFSGLILIVIAIISLNNYRLTVDAAEQNSQVYIQEIMRQVNTNIQTYIDNMENISLLALTNKDVTYYISSNSFIGKNDIRPYEKRISDLFQNILYSRNDIASIMVFGYNGRTVSDRRITALNPNIDPKQQSWYINAQKMNGKSIVSPPHIQNVISGEYRWVVSLSRELKSNDGITPEGIFLVDLNLSVIDKLCSQIYLGKKGYVFIVDGTGNIIYHPQQQLLYSNLATEEIPQVLTTASGQSFTADDNKGKRIYSVQDTGLGWKIVGVTYSDDLIANKSSIQHSILLYALLGIGISIIISLLLSLHLTKPIKRLQQDMKQVELGNFHIQTSIEEDNEINQLGQSFNVMVNEIKHLMDETVQTSEQKRKTELLLLQAQINPHFLYNTLDSIIWMAEQEKHEEVVDMTSALAKMFRASITRDQELVSIRVEIEHIRHYLFIQKMRYREQLDYVFDIPSDILQYKTVKILLQPFIENAIYHGIRSKTTPGIIYISARQEQDDLLFEVRDNGLGMTAERLAQVNEGTVATNTQHGIGIGNVNERIQLYFGATYGMSIHSVLGEGTVVTIRVPAIL